MKNFCDFYYSYYHIWNLFDEIKCYSKIKDDLKGRSGVMSTKDKKMGQLSRQDIIKEKEKNGLRIIPFENECVKAASYDITPTIIAMSAKTGMLEKVYREKHYNNDQYYVLVHAKDTVLIVSNEYIVMPEYIAGYVSSRVSKLVDGFGHISTTIDPNWKGAALIALSNPSNQPHKVYVGKKEDKGKQNQLATVSFHYLNTPCKSDDKEGVHRGMRLDLLEKVSYKNKTGIMAFLRKFFCYRRRKFTDYFFEVCEQRYGELNEKTWKSFLNEFSYLDKSYDSKDEKLSKKAKLRAVDFIITENVFTRIIFWMQKRKGLVYIIVVALIFILCYIGVIPQDMIENLINILQTFK